MLKNCGHQDIIQGLKELAERGQIEFTGTAKYHPILPLIPLDEAKRQIELNRKTNNFFLGEAYKPVGFLFPEMAYSRDVLPAVIETGHRWIILSGVACSANWPVDMVYQVECEGKRLAVFFRDDILSNKVSFQEQGPGDFLEHLKAQKGDRENIYVITAMDAETYGHHIQDWEELFLAEVYEELQVRSETYAHIQQKKVMAAQQSSLLQDRETVQQVQIATISQVLEHFPAGDVIDAKPSSWSTTSQDIEAGNPYPLWSDKGNEIHRLQWEHLAICMEISLKAIQVADSDESKRFVGIARGLLDRSLHSCQFWWASRKAMWDINLIHIGLIDRWRTILNAYRAKNTSGANLDVKKELYYKLVAARDVRNKVVDHLFTL
jgi:alpha-amylase/alpha-mannosidase (GH57 family)